jgi:aryl-alcohol dehydrogenase-like predicted oxidoreductase
MEVSRFCLGTMGFGGKALDRAACDRVVGEALDHGINFIDTAEGYGQSEALLGDVLGPRRDQVFISTKVFSQHTRDGRCGRNSRHNIFRSAEDSLQRLKTDFIDLYLLHHPDPDTPLDETVVALDDLVSGGLVRYVGCSNHYAWQMALMRERALALGCEPVVTDQVCYNVLDRPAENELASFCTQCNVPLMAYSPLSGGLLTGRYTPGEPLPADSSIATRFGGKLKVLYESETVQNILRELTSIAETGDLSMMQISLLWLAAKPYVGTVILGGTRPEHFQAAYPVADTPLPPELVERIDTLSEPQVFKTFRNQPFDMAPAGV